MTSAAAVSSETGHIEAILRRNMRIDGGQAVSVTPITEHSNLNHVYRVNVGERNVYVKVVPERPKKLPMKLPRERVFSEAEAMRRFGAHAGGHVDVPEVLFVDGEDFALGMTDVGEGRSVLLDVAQSRYELLLGQAANLGAALGAVHAATAGMPPFRPEMQDQMLRAIVFDGLIAPGAKAAFPEAADAMLLEMRKRRDCLVHADLWGKNILVGEGVKAAIVDFEGAFIGDPAFDVATVLAVSLLPALYRPELTDAAVCFAEAFIEAYGRASSATGEAADWAIVRGFWYAGALVAARGFGPFAYPMDDETRARVRAVAGMLAGQAPAAISEYAAVARQAA